MSTAALLEKPSLPAVHAAHQLGVSTGPRVAIVHCWLPLYGGAERVLEQMLHVFPEADVFSIIDTVPEADRAFLQGKKVRTSFVQRLPGGRKHYRHFLPLMPLAVEQFDLREYDIIVSNSYAVAKGAITGPDQLHVCYCSSPIRYAWDLQPQYLEEAGLTRGLKSLLVRAALHYIRLWDARTAAGVDHFLANSHFVSRRIRKVYRREATVVHPPVDVEKFTLETQKGSTYVTASRMVPYKRMDLIAEAFSKMPDRRLIIAGDGPDFRKVKAKAGPNVELMGYQPQAQFQELVRNARAFLFAAEEDFGIVAVEAQACGTPVIAYSKGGVRETVAPDVTGVLFDEQTVEGICAAVERFERIEANFDPVAIRRNAERFSVARFRYEFGEFVEDRWNEFQVETKSAHL